MTPLAIIDHPLQGDTAADGILDVYLKIDNKKTGSGTERANVVSEAIFKLDILLFPSPFSYSTPHNRLIVGTQEGGPITSGQYPDTVKIATLRHEMDTRAFQLLTGTFYK